MKRVISVVILLLFCAPIYGQMQQSESVVEIYFVSDEGVIDYDFASNKESMDRLETLTKRAINSDDPYTITNIKIVSSTSPEGGISRNKKLAAMRTEYIHNMLVNDLSIPASSVELVAGGIAWDQLREIVSNSDMTYKDEVITIIDDVPEETWARINPDDKWKALTDSRIKHLMDLKGGVPYWYIRDNFFPQIRKSLITITYKFEEPVAKPEPEPVAEPVVESVVAPVVVPVLEPEPEPVAEPVVESVVAPVVVPVLEPEVLEPEVEEQVVEELPVVEYTATVETETKPLFALKTNLLYDLASIVNVELEIPIGDRSSIAAEWIFPWWVWDDGTEESLRHRLQLLNGNFEVKRWFGDRSKRDVMTGWYMGLYVGCGIFDIELDGEGYQGESFYTAGLSGGYAHTINKSGSLRMEYSLGVGYFGSEYSYYESSYYDDAWHSTKIRTEKVDWIGPTSAKISLVWMLNRKVKR